MLEIIYRIYEVADEETAAANLKKDIEFGLYSSKDATTKQLWWEAFFINSLEFEQIRPLTKEETICYKYIEKYGVYSPLAIQGK